MVERECHLPDFQPLSTFVIVFFVTAAKTQHFLFIFNETPGAPVGAAGTTAGAENHGRLLLYVVSVWTLHI